VIPVAGLLVLAGLGLFLAGVLTGTNAWFWGCVIVCGLAGLLLVVAYRRIAAARRAPRATAVPAARAATAARSGAPRADTGAHRAREAGRPGAPTAGAPATAPGPTAPGEQPPGEQPPGEQPEGVPPGAGVPGAEPSGAPGRAAETPRTVGPGSEPPTRGRHAPPSSPAGRSAAGRAGEPPLEEVEVTDLLLVVDLRDEVLVVDEHPRYHLGGCRWLSGKETIPLPVDEARTDGFTPCGSCEPDRHLADVARARRAVRE
jgi:hypothetical protein